MIESLEAAKATGHSLDSEIAAWVAAISEEIHGRLSRVGLVPPRKKAEAAVTLGQHLDTVFAAFGPQKKTTAANYDRARRLLEEFFGKDRLPMSVTHGDADDYKAWLLRKCAIASTSVDLRRAKPFFKLAVRRRSITENPFSDVKCGSQINDSRREFVSQETIERVIKACANHG
jgi:site-specific recombinase XerD